MILYNVIFFSLVLTQFSLKTNSHWRTLVYPIVLCLLFIFAGFRFEVGCDWFGYLNQWQLQKDLPIQLALLNTDPTWWVMIDIIQSLGFSYPWLNLASSGIFFFGLHVIARRQPDPLGFLVLLYPILIINMPMSGIRQAVAIGIMCFAINSFIDKRTLWFVTWTLLASTFHNSAIIFILLSPLVGKNYIKTRMFASSILAIPGFLVIVSGAGAATAISRYIDTDIDAAGAIFRVGLISLTGIGYFWILRKKWKHTFPQDYHLITLGGLALCAIILIIPVSTVIADRMSYFLIIIQTIIFARIPYLPIRKSKKFYTVAPYLALGLLFIVWTSTSSLFTQCYVPYSSWLFSL